MLEGALGNACAVVPDLGVGKHGGAREGLLHAGDGTHALLEEQRRAHLDDVHHIRDGTHAVDTVVDAVGIQCHL